MWKAGLQSTGHIDKQAANDPEAVGFSEHVLHLCPLVKDHIHIWSVWLKKEIKLPKFWGYFGPVPWKSCVITCFRWLILTVLIRFIVFTGLLNNKHAKWHQDCHIRFNQCSILLLVLLPCLTVCLTSKASGLGNSGWQKEPNCHASLMSISPHCAGEPRSSTNRSQIWLLNWGTF